MIFKDRADAGKKLAQLLERFRGEDVVVYALPRGGVITGVEIAKAIHAPLDLIITRKIGHPYSPEYAIGAIAENGHAVLNQQEVAGIDQEYLSNQIEEQKMEAKRRRDLYLSGRRPITCSGKIAIVVDDGIATGLTMKAAIKELRLHYHPRKIIVAVPVAPAEVAKEIESGGAEFVALDIPEVFHGSIGAYYQDFSQVTDYEVLKLMKGEKEHGRIPVPAI